MAKNRNETSRCAVRAAPSSRVFHTYMRTVLRPILEGEFSRMQVSVFMELFSYLEQTRYDFSADRAYQTRPISNAEIADHFGVQIRTVRRWIAALEKLGILKRDPKKNPCHKFKNLFNRLRFVGFKDWLFETHQKARPDNPCPPIKKDIKDIHITSKKMGEDSRANEPSAGVSPAFKEIAFPPNGSIRYSDLWKSIALRHLPEGRGRPCMDMIAQRFREHLSGYKIPLNHRSVLNRWTKYCQRAKPIT